MESRENTTVNKLFHFGCERANILERLNIAFTAKGKRQPALWKKLNKRFFLPTTKIGDRSGRQQQIPQ